MKASNIWHNAKNVNIQNTTDMEPGFNVGFDKKIPPETREELLSFVKWVEQNFNIPITLWVDFEYKHYLITKDGKRVGFLFYWADFKTYPTFRNEDDIPEIRLPVRTEHCTIEEILVSFIEAITYYFAWICNEISAEFEANKDDIADILQEYLQSRK